MTVFEILNWSAHYLKDHRVENPLLNAELLLARSLSFRREELYVHLQSLVGQEEKETFEGFIKRRISGEPLQYILGHQEFWSIDFRVDSRALIPRPETELLVEQALLILSRHSWSRIPAVLEIGTGSGAIAVTLAKEMKNIFLVATDISKDALVLAKENAKSADVQDRITFVNGDLFDPFHPPKERTPFDLILSNPPYIIRRKINTLAREVKNYEPRVALDGGEDGLTFYRRIIPEAPFYLRESGWLLLEVALGQSGSVFEMIEEEGNFLDPQCIPDLSGIGRVVKAQKRENRE
jgi:release factor glutamine methyltransferase